MVLLFLFSLLCIKFYSCRPVGRALVMWFAKKFGWLIGLQLSFIFINCINPLLVLLLVNAVQSSTTSISGNAIFSNAWQVVVVLSLSYVVQLSLKQQFYWVGLKAGMTVSIWLIFVTLLSYSK
jgi:hypothetical protein